MSLSAKCRAAELQSLAGLGTGFLSLVTHEIRTPLAAATSSAELLTLRHEGWDPQKRSRVIARMGMSLERIDGILADVSFVERVAAGREAPDTESVVLSKLATRCVGTEIPVEAPPEERPVRVPVDTVERLIRHLLAYLLPESSGRAAMETLYSNEAGAVCGRLILRAPLDSVESCRRLCEPDARRQSFHLRLAELLAALHGWRVIVSEAAGATVQVTVEGVCRDDA